MTRSRLGPAAALALSLLTGCAPTGPRRAELPAPAPQGVVGVVYTGAAMSWRPFNVTGVYCGTGLMIDDRTLLITDHQNPFVSGPVAPDTLSHPLFPPVLLAWSWPGGARPWLGLRLVSHEPRPGAVSAALVRSEQRALRDIGQAFKGEVDLGWAVLRVEPPQPTPRVRIDFERPLRPNQEVYLLRPVQFRDDAPWKARFVPGKTTPREHFALVRDAMDEISEQPLAFDAWRGRLVPRPEGPTRDIGPDHPWLERAGFIYFGFAEDMGGASGGPVLIREDGEWIAVGIYTGALNYDNLVLVRYQYGVFVRPDLTGMTAAGGEPVEAAKR
jgi:hypothetical protein